MQNQGQKTLQKKLKKVLNSHTGLHELRLLLDEADSKGFQGAEIERARRIMKDYDRQQWLPFWYVMFLSFLGSKDIQFRVHVAKEILRSMPLL